MQQLETDTACSDWEINHVGAEQGNSLELALAALVRWDEINANHHNEKRVSERYFYSTRTLVNVTLPAANKEGLEEPGGEVCFEAWARNLSGSGMSLLVPRELLPKVVEHPARGKYSAELLSVGRTVLIRLQGKADSVRIVSAQVVRARNVLHNFHECGVRFLQ